MKTSVIKWRESLINPLLIAVGISSMVNAVSAGKIDPWSIAAVVTSILSLIAFVLLAITKAKVEHEIALEREVPENSKDLIEIIEKKYSGVRKRANALFCLGVLFWLVTVGLLFHSNTLSLRSECKQHAKLLSNNASIMQLVSQSASAVQQEQVLSLLREQNDLIEEIASKDAVAKCDEILRELRDQNNKMRLLVESQSKPKEGEAAPKPVDATSQHNLPVIHQ